ncbi:unnamed protein product [Penicillium salamii]|uniref:MADS-box domain-containing protein n=1 Tax=Penicillium salamii TaxID=1612424 RepID=A0A9W4IZU2_9EURO|nr:unnamed protein product [Penicillium salamii]CAG8175643.1 unnamed protein product [Penicillium salamii]CAG8222747.1 unnamed protein product [Penicillium salamii]CAG8224257.1 unnamed protein product [Penicillium salamii]CAG8312684.1 unnamed protein product [Penicillium salamii]
MLAMPKTWSSRRKPCLYNGQNIPRTIKALEKISLRQKRDRRKNNLEKKSQEYSEICGADVCLGIRIRELGKVFIFSADASGVWSFLGSQLVCAVVESLRGFKYQA